MAKDAITFNAFKDVPEVDVPVCFIAGAYDYTCCWSLQQEYYEFVGAPQKDMYLFENSAHSPLWENPSVTCEALRQIKERTLNG